MVSYNPRRSIGAAHSHSPRWRLALGISPLLARWLAGCATSATSTFNRAVLVPGDTVLALTYFTSSKASVIGVCGTDGAPLRRLFWQVAPANTSLMA